MSEHPESELAALRVELQAARDEADSLREQLYTDEAMWEGRKRAEAALQDARDAISAVVDAAEKLTRPGVSGPAEHVAVARMTAAIQAAAELIGSPGVFPELLPPGKDTP